MTMKYSFAELGQNILTRKFGGTTVGVADPYVTGYHFIWFDKIPPKLAEYIVNNGISGISSSVKWSVPGNIDYGNTVSVKFLEFNKTPLLDIMHNWVKLIRDLLDIMHNWVKLIRDYRTGVSDLEDGPQGEGYTKKTYAGLMYYWTTAPDAKTVEYYAAYDGIFPSKDPQDLYTSEVYFHQKIHKIYIPVMLKLSVVLILRLNLMLIILGMKGGYMISVKLLQMILLKLKKQLKVMVRDNLEHKR